MTLGMNSKDRWQKALDAAVEAYDTRMPWERGTQRKSMIERRKQKIAEAAKQRMVQIRSA